MLKELGKQYIKTAEQLRKRAAELAAHGRLSGNTGTVSARVNDLRKIAARLSGYGEYLCRYYELGGSTDEKQKD